MQCVLEQSRRIIIVINWSNIVCLWYGATKIVHVLATMGDFLSPKRKDVVERLRRRIDLYRRRQNGISQRFEPCINQIYEQSRQETLHLHQKWQDSRAKKAKQSKSKDTCSSGESKSSCQTVSTLFFNYLHKIILIILLNV